MASSIFKDIEKGNLQSLKRTVSVYQSSVVAKNPVDNRTPLHLAAALGLPAFVRELLIHGAPHDAVDKYGFTPLHLAAASGVAASVAELLTGPGRKLLVKAKSKEGQTPLHLAAKNGHLEVINKLIEAGARTDAKDKASLAPIDLCPAEAEEVRQLLLIPTSGASASLLRGSLDFGGLSLSEAINNGSGSKSLFFPPGAAAGVHLIASGLPPSREGSVSRRASGAAQGMTAAAAAAVTHTATLQSLQSLQSQQNQQSAETAKALEDHEMSIMELAADVKIVQEQLGTAEACASAQVEMGAQLARCLDALTKQERHWAEVEIRVSSQEARARELHLQLIQLEEEKRASARAAQEAQDLLRQQKTERLNQEARLDELARHVASLSSRIPERASGLHPSGSLAEALQAEMVGMRSTVTSLTSRLDFMQPAAAAASAAAASHTNEIASLSRRLDHLTGDVAIALNNCGGGGSGATSQLQSLQAQVQLLQVPVARLTQQQVETTAQIGELTQQQRLLREGGAGSAAGNNGQVLEHVTGVLETTAASIATLTQGSKDLAAAVEQVRAELEDLKRHQDATAAVSSMAPDAPLGRALSAPTTPGLPPPRSGNAPAAGDDTVTLGVLKQDLENVKAQLYDSRRESNAEGGALRREWQRTFADMRQRFSEQASELRAREGNIAKMREAMLVEEAERRAVSGFESKVSHRLQKTELGVDSLTHRVEVLEDQVASTSSLIAALPPALLAAAEGGSNPGSPVQLAHPTYRTGLSPSVGNGGNGSSLAKGIKSPMSRTVTLGAATPSAAAGSSNSNSNNNRVTSATVPSLGGKHLSTHGPGPISENVLCIAAADPSSAAVLATARKYGTAGLFHFSSAAASSHSSIPVSSSAPPQTLASVASTATTQPLVELLAAMGIANEPVSPSEGERENFLWEGKSPTGVQAGHPTQELRMIFSPPSRGITGAEAGSLDGPADGSGKPNTNYDARCRGGPGGHDDDSSDSDEDVDDCYDDVCEEDDSEEDDAEDDGLSDSYSLTRVAIADSSGPGGGNMNMCADTNATTNNDNGGGSSVDDIWSRPDVSAVPYVRSRSGSRGTPAHGGASPVRSGAHEISPGRRGTPGQGERGEEAPWRAAGNVTRSGTSDIDEQRIHEDSRGSLPPYSRSSSSASFLLECPRGRPSSGTALVHPEMGHAGGGSSPLYVSPSGDSESMVQQASRAQSASSAISIPEFRPMMLGRAATAGSPGYFCGPGGGAELPKKEDVDVEAGDGQVGLHPATLVALGDVFGVPQLHSGTGLLSSSSSQTAVSPTGNGNDDSEASPSLAPAPATSSVALIANQPTKPNPNPSSSSGPDGGTLSTAWLDSFSGDGNGGSGSLSAVGPTFISYTSHVNVATTDGSSGAENNVSLLSAKNGGLKPKPKGPGVCFYVCSIQ